MEICKYAAYGEIEFGDSRLSKRLEKTLETMHENPSLQICSASSDRYEAKGIYRFVKNNKVTKEAIIRTSRDETMKAIRESGEKIVLFPQDTCELCYDGLKGCEGLGTHRGKDSLGMLSHTSIAVSPSSRVFGLTSQELWTRPIEEHGKANERKKKDIEEKESNKWIETMKMSMNGLPDDIMGVTVCDREGDIYDLFAEAEAEGIKYLVRIVQNRLTYESEKLLDYAKGLESSGEIVVQIPRDTRNKRPAREAKLSIKHSKVSVTGKRKSDCVDAYVVAAEEVGAPDGVEPIAWYLLTNVDTDSFDEACDRVQWYVQRWKIERFHYAWKDVCKVERIQEREVGNLKKVIVLKTIVAMTIVCLMYLSRTAPDLPCDVFLEEDEWKFLYAAVNHTDVFPPLASLTV